jgi:hypothetical protein
LMKSQYCTDFLVIPVERSTLMSHRVICSGMYLFVISIVEPGDM